VSQSVQGTSNVQQVLGLQKQQRHLLALKHSNLTNGSESDQERKRPNNYITLHSENVHIYSAESASKKSCKTARHPMSSCKIYFMIMTAWNDSLHYLRL